MPFVDPEAEKHDVQESAAALAEGHEAVARLLPRVPALLESARRRMAERLKTTKRKRAATLPHPWRPAAADTVDGLWAHIVELEPEDAAAWIRAFGEDTLMNHETPFDLHSRLVKKEITRLRRERAGRIHENTKAESRLATLRVERGLTQEEMVRRTGLNPTTYWRLERKRIKNPPIGYLAACARVLEVELEAVLEAEYLDWQP
jgi:DNA-binding XRE family transcriptional regulator